MTGVACKSAFASRRGLATARSLAMATASRSTIDPLAVASWSDGGEADSKSSRYLARRLAAAGADYKGVALTTFLLAASVAFMLWLAAGVVVEHWLVPGGLPTWGRWTWFAVGLAALLVAVVRWIVPLLRYRVNLVYAARVIERDHPDLHNDLVNAVLVQAQGGAAAPLVVKSLRRRAAKRLSGVPAEGVIDRTPALRLAYALAALVAAACIYELAAPKSLASTTARLVAPWLSMAAPARVHIAAPVLSWRLPSDSVSAAATDRVLPVSGAGARGALRLPRLHPAAGRDRGLAGGRARRRGDEGDRHRREQPAAGGRLDRPGL
ncbi:MAG: hypothetical protein EBR23_08890 [Planctomycetia bacterium]|nr:hypothetical protein [Planctomycetia bacterium]